MATKKKAKPKPVIETEEQKEDEAHNRRLDWELNHDKISQAYLKLVTTGKKQPTMARLAQETGLTTKTIERHLEAKEFQTIITNLRAVRGVMLTKLMAMVSSSKNPAMDLYLTLTEPEYADSKRTRKVDVTSKGEKITDSIDYTKLSTEALLELVNAAAKDTTDKPGKG